MFSRSSNRSKTTPSVNSSQTTPDRIRSKQPFSAVPLEQRKNRPAHVPLDKLLEVYDDYPLLVKDYENLSERLRLAEQSEEEANNIRENTQVLLDKERNLREDDRKQAIKDKAQAEKDVDKRVRGELDPKIAALEKKLKEMTADRDATREELKYRTDKLELWTGDLARLHGETNAQAERETKAAEERQKVLEKSKTLHMEILKGLREISERPEKSVLGPSTTSTDKTKGTPSFVSGKSKTEKKEEPAKKRNYDIAD